jgi:putative aminopeptidase FrvX
MLLARLSEAAGVSGQENEIRNLIKTEASRPGVDIKTDALGNVLACKQGRQDAPTVMIAAHMDEVGLMIVGVEDSGLLRFKPVGGIDRRVLLV